MNASEIRVGPLVRIRSVPSPFNERYRMRIVTCLHCLPMNGGATEYDDGTEGRHWHKECSTFYGALIIAGNHLNACHSNGASGDM